jgi:hypothetical protein
LEGRSLQDPKIAFTSKRHKQHAFCAFPATDVHPVNQDADGGVGKPPALLSRAG